jgi:hypothetical protein
MASYEAIGLTARVNFALQTMPLSSVVIFTPEGMEGMSLADEFVMSNLLKV